MCWIDVDRFGSNWIDLDCIGLILIVLAWVEPGRVELDRIGSFGLELVFTLCWVDLGRIGLSGID